MADDDRRDRLETRLRRVEELASSLDALSDPTGREHARELVETLLDLHGVAIARMTALAVQEEWGASLLERLGRDPQVAPVLLLHGLHPDDLRTRVGAALGRLGPKLAPREVRIAGWDVARRDARLRVEGDADGATRVEIEAALLEAAPDLDSIDIRFEQAGEEVRALSAASVR